MLQAREIVTTVGTLACAVGIGFIMQSGEAAERGSNSVESATVANHEREVISQGPEANAFLEVEGIILTSSQFDSPEIVLPNETNVELASTTTSVLETPVPETAVPRPDLACQVTVQATVSKAAMIELSLNAPCLPNERVTVHHRGMMFTQTTSLDGTLNTTVPALDENALFIFAFANGDGAVTQLRVPELSQYNRTVIQWKGDTGFEMHAREFGANYGEDGHVWRDTARDPSAIDTAKGFLTRLGNPEVAEGLMAEVYTFPATMSGLTGTVDLSVEAEVTAQNCGLEIEAQSLELSEGVVKTQNLTLSVPDCDAKGSFLVLNNLVEDLTVASN